ncbi:MAG: hypothetical protein MZV70_60565 [Desulfobacterales bacterium]|nr:hypothetical protein [Desulfobacterales bacterium]
MTRSTGRDFYPLHADFFSRLAMTFDQGDYAAVDADPGQAGSLPKPFTGGRSAIHPDARACLGLGILNQKAGRHAEAADILTAGLRAFSRRRAAAGLPGGGAR